jgi:hypothetical protein
MVVNRPTFPLGSDKARSDQARFLIAPVENRTYHFHGIRLSTFGHSPCSHEAFLHISPAPRVSTRVQLARSLGTFAPVFPKARGLRLGDIFPVCPAFLSADYYAPSDSCEDIGNFVGLSLTYSPLPFAFLQGLPCSQGRTQTGWFRWRVTECPVPSFGAPPSSSRVASG